VRSRTAGVMTTLMRNGRDRRSGKPVKCHAILERELLFGTRSADYIRASSHSGCIATEVILQAKQAEYMAAPERFAEMPDFSLAPRAPSIHGTSLRSLRCKSLDANGLKADISRRFGRMARSLIDPMYGPAVRSKKILTSWG
jgi:hypothetical protein